MREALALESSMMCWPLIFSILTLAPETRRILVGTRIWITNVIALYKKFGFDEYKREGGNVKFRYVGKK